jgi:site-specific DNA-methyltransferase (adenine-specific)
MGPNLFGSDINKEYIDITMDRVENKEKSDSKIGSTWVSFFLNELITIRDKDWGTLEEYYTIPQNTKDIDFLKIKLSQSQPVLM